MRGVNMGMDIDDFSDRMMEIGKGLNALSGNMYAAIEDDVSIEEVKSLLTIANKKIELFEKLSAEVTGGMHDELQGTYGDFIERIRKHSKKLQEKIS
jgi:hypothetical protein